MLTNSVFQCEDCENKAEYSLSDKKYCKKHYIRARFKADTIHGYLDKFKIPHCHHALDNHIILNKRSSDILELCKLLELKLEEDYWFGVGKLGSIDFSDNIHIKEKGEVK